MMDLSLRFFGLVNRNRFLVWCLELAVAVGLKLVFNGNRTLGIMLAVWVAIETVALLVHLWGPRYNGEEL